MHRISHVVFSIISIIPKLLCHIKKQPSLTPVLIAISKKRKSYLFTPFKNIPSAYARHSDLNYLYNSKTKDKGFWKCTDKLLWCIESCTKDTGTSLSINVIYLWYDLDHENTSWKPITNGFPLVYFTMSTTL